MRWLYDKVKREALVGSRVQSVSNGASRVRIDANRIPFTVGCVDVNHGDRKPVVMFRLNQDTLNRKEMSFNVI